MLRIYVQRLSFQLSSFHCIYILEVLGFAKKKKCNFPQSLDTSAAWKSVLQYLVFFATYAVILTVRSATPQRAEVLSSPVNFCGWLHLSYNPLAPRGPFIVSFRSTALFRISSLTFVYTTLFPLPITDSMVRNQCCQELCNYPIFRCILSRQRCGCYASSAVIKSHSVRSTVQLLLICDAFCGLTTSYITNTTSGRKVYDRLPLLHFQCATYYVLIVSASGALRPLVTETYHSAQL